MCLEKDGSWYSSIIFKNQSSQVFSLTCSKNEEDIVEAFIRLNSRIVDTFIFFDSSTDSTREILSKLKNEGFNILVIADSFSSSYDQGIIMTSLLRDALKLGKKGDFWVKNGFR
jgi:hypothetical protein